MAIRNVALVGEEFFHIYNRGNSKQKIFLDTEDYERFVKLLYLCNSEYNINFRNDIVKKHIDAFEFQRGKIIVHIGAWVLMPNHFHLYLSSPKQGLGPNEMAYITKFMLKLCTSYAKYFNKKYNRTGKLFEDKFKSVHINNDAQAKYLFSYIHLNPVKIIDPKWKEEGVKNSVSILKYLNSYRWSSFLDFAGRKRKESGILERKNFLDYFGSIKNFEKEIFDWLKIPRS